MGFKIISRTEKAASPENCPERTIDSSPRFQLRDKFQNRQSPVGAAEIKYLFQSSLWDSTNPIHNPAVKTAGYCRSSLRDIYYRVRREIQTVEILEFWHGARRDPVLS